MPRLTEMEKCLFHRQKDLLHFFLIIIPLLFSPGCATFSRVRSRLTQEHYLEQVPFVEQKRNWCGPAALTTILNYWGDRISQEEVAGEVYRSSIRATLTLDMVRFGEERGLWAETKTGDISDIIYLLSREIPTVLLIQPYPLIKKRHYLVVVGVSEEDKVFIVHTGRRANGLVSFRHLRRIWQGGGNIMIVLAPPEKIDWELDASGYNHLGLIFERKGKLEEALLNYEKALAKEESAEPHFNLANVYQKKGERNKAIFHYDKAIAIRPDFADAYNNLACLYQKTRPDEAERLARQTIELGGRNLAYYWDTLGEIQLIRGEAEEARASFLKAQESLEKDDSLAALIQEHLEEAEKLLTGEEKSDRITEHPVTDTLIP